MREQIEKLVQEELDRANAKFPQFASRHEGYAVLLEEVEETQSELEQLKKRMALMWSSVKENNSYYLNLTVDDTQKIAINLIAEAIQVAAMAKKYQALLKPDLSPDAEEEEHL